MLARKLHDMRTPSPSLQTQEEFQDESMQDDNDDVDDDADEDTHEGDNRSRDQDGQASTSTTATRNNSSMMGQAHRHRHPISHLKRVNNPPPEMEDDFESIATRVLGFIEPTVGRSSSSSISTYETTQHSSASGSGEEGGNGRVVRRAVSRKPNLLPKSKSHLRVLSQLRADDGPADQLEIASEATLHRMSRSGASPISTIRYNNNPTMAPGSSGWSHHHVEERRTSNVSSSSHGGIINSGPRPTPNRFPEQAIAACDDSLGDWTASSGDEEEDLGEAGSDWGGMSMGYGTEDEAEDRRSSIWTGIRGSGAGAGASASGSITSSFNAMTTSNGSAQSRTTSGYLIGKSPGNEKGRNDSEIISYSPSTPSWAISTRPSKRKVNDDRYEPYAQAFKRRAVSPASGLSPSGLGSPLMSFTQPLASPTHLPTLPSAVNSLPLPISIPSPAVNAHNSFFSSLNYHHHPRSLASSPVANLLSSSAGRGNNSLSHVLGMGMVLNSRAEKEDQKSGKMGEAEDVMGRMTLE